MRTDLGGPKPRLSRPAVSVVVPFFGDRSEAEALVAALAVLALGEGDELIAVDNGSGGLLAAASGTGIRVVEALEERSSYHARNVGAELAKGEWLLFTDADCRAPATLLDDFFAEPIGGEVGALAGSIRPAPGQRGLLARWAATREILSQARSLEAGTPSARGPDRAAALPAAATANLLVRRTAWESVGGFLEGVRSGADFEFCWRLQDAGWLLESRPAAVIEHVHRETLAGVIRQMSRYAAGNAWQERRRPGSSPRPQIARGLARGAAGAAGFTLTGRLERGAMKAVDVLAVGAQALGRLSDNAAPRPSASSSGDAVAIVAGRFPMPPDDPLRAELESLLASGRSVRVVALARPDGPAIGRAPGVEVDYLEDAGPLSRLRDLAWLVIRHPLRSLADLVRRRRLPPEQRLPLRALAPVARRVARRGSREVRVQPVGFGDGGARLAGLTGVRARP